jgi:hypothetical protein
LQQQIQTHSNRNQKRENNIGISLFQKIQNSNPTEPNKTQQSKQTNGAEPDN